MRNASTLSSLQLILNRYETMLVAASDGDPDQLGHFILYQGDAYLDARLLESRTGDQRPYLELASLENEGIEKQGNGRTLVLRLFDIADQTNINVISVTASDIGRYAHASYHAVCKPRDLSKLKQDLLHNLTDYSLQQTGTAKEKNKRSRQAAEARAIIYAADARLGNLVDQLRTNTIGACEQPTLAKELFLKDKKRCHYDAYWDRSARIMARIKLAERPKLSQIRRTAASTAECA